MDLLIGYGSLINPNHRERIGLPREAEEVRIQGYERRWNVKAINKKTYLGVTPSLSSWLNAVLIPMTEDQLRMLDRWESAYDRIRVEESALSLPLSAGSTAWIYLPQPRWTLDEPSSEHVVKRGYVDLVFEGCLAYGSAFCQEFLTTTTQWDQYWFDNRLPSHPLRSEIDQLTDVYYPSSRRVLELSRRADRPSTVES